MADKPQPVDLQTLPLNTLKDVYAQLENEIKSLDQSMDQLDLVVTKYKASLHSIEELIKMKKKQVLVPCTDSMYIEGEVFDEDTLIVDIGTGFFVEKTPADAITFFKQRLDYIKEQWDAIQSVISQKSQALLAIQEVIINKDTDDLPGKLHSTKISQ